MVSILILSVLSICIWVVFEQEYKYIVYREAVGGSTTECRGGYRRPYLMPPHAPWEVTLMCAAARSLLEPWVVGPMPYAPQFVGRSRFMKNSQWIRDSFFWILFFFECIIIIISHQLSEEKKIIEKLRREFCLLFQHISDLKTTVQYSVAYWVWFS